MQTWLIPSNGVAFQAADIDWMCAIQEHKSRNLNRAVAWPKVVRAEDEVTFKEAVAPALSVLSAPHFEAANLEFRDALDEYRKGHYGDCLTKCGSAFESVMKIVCKRNGWAFDANKDTAGPLLKIIVSNSTLDPFFTAADADCDDRKSVEQFSRRRDNGSER